MSLFRHLLGPLLMLGIFIITTVLGLVSGGAVWIALSLLCAWPMLFAVSAWTIRGLKDHYRLVSKQPSAKREARGIPSEAAQW